MNKSSYDLKYHKQLSLESILDKDSDINGLYEKTKTIPFPNHFLLPIGHD